ncbi:NB-ARC domain-containing protein [Nocardia aurantiaca]|uniref:Uncharacterized protein n=1 Tax=Nocardia aurantiaca TaxID=2675850 RepID=A0A6I3KZK0_9NOCA|nr:NB-ARC domain-containing protein [Nocardia aurantiaca]MTE13674.1 hypothetical protein [Nocardia aurantiaca]
MTNLARARLEFQCRLGASWEDLAVLLGIKPYVSDGFAQGREASGIWRWLEERQRLAELPDALIHIDRTDLAALFAEMNLAAATDSMESSVSVTAFDLDPDLDHPVVEPRSSVPAALLSDQIVVGEIPGAPMAFVERETLDQLARALDRNRVAVVVCTLTGMRGVGKTQLAAAYARSRIADGCGVVGWVNAETSSELIAGLTRIAERLNVADPQGDSAESARRLTEHLATRRGDAVIVFDNATDPDALNQYVPASGARVIITSTNRSFTELGTPIDVGTYTRQESLGYLAERTGRDEDPGASTIAEELGDLPLALASAAATIKARRLDYDAYCTLLRDQPVVETMRRRKGDSYPGSTAGALLLNVETVAAGDATGLCATLIGIIALLSPEGVPRELLHGVATARQVTTEAIESALEQCVDGSVLTWSFSGDAVIMHRLMARVLWEKYRADGDFVAIATEVLDLIEPRMFDSSQAWDRRHEGSWLISHAEALWEALQEEGLT